ncbi:hypothetical protein [Helicobacter sp.]|uniref:hypothetical protein n=1 Tax=Helicobacter sp. TaxID=218 RepID=UPI0025C13FDD|nr:hypothetical protein [Helicobacter sp.]MCI5632708.1 hypothetical protein [Helicobacter sp.]
MESLKKDKVIDCFATLAMTEVRGCNDGRVTFCHCEIPLVESWRALRKASYPL